jgi:hypothetical protein
VLYTPELLADAASGMRLVRCERVRRGPEDAEVHGEPGPVGVDTVLVAIAP